MQHEGKQWRMATLRLKMNGSYLVTLKPKPQNPIDLTQPPNPTHCWRLCSDATNHSGAASKLQCSREVCVKLLISLGFFTKLWRESPKTPTSVSCQATWPWCILLKKKKKKHTDIATAPTSQGNHQMFYIILQNKNNWYLFNLPTSQGNNLKTLGNRIRTRPQSGTFNGSVDEKQFPPRESRRTEVIMESR